MRVSRVFRYGNSAGVVLPKALLTSLGWRVGTHVVLEPAGEFIRVRLAPECAPLTDSEEITTNAQTRTPPRGRTFAR